MRAIQRGSNHNIYAHLVRKNSEQSNKTTAEQDSNNDSDKRHDSNEKNDGNYAWEWLLLTMLLVAHSIALALAYARI